MDEELFRQLFEGMSAAPPQQNPLVELLMALSQATNQTGTSPNPRAAVQEFFGMSSSRAEPQESFTFREPVREGLSNLAALFTNPGAPVGRTEFAEQPDATRVAEDLFLERIAVDQFLRGIQPQPGR